MPGLLLMENAGRGCVDVLLRVGGPLGLVVVVCGKGNNGGDGLVIARRLDLLGVPVRVVLGAEPAELRGDAAANWAIVERSGLDVAIVAAEENGLPARLDRLLAGANWIVDALLGTGAVGEPRGVVAAAIAAIHGSPARKLAVDLPSGLDCDTGAAAASTVRADHTCTFVALKPGFLRPEAAEYLGQVHVVDIGCPRKLLG